MDEYSIDNDIPDEIIEKFKDILENDPMADIENVLDWAEPATELVLQNPVLSGICRALGIHAKENDSIPPFLRAAVRGGFAVMDDLGHHSEDVEHPEWIDGFEDVELIILGVLQLAVVNTMIDSLLLLAKGVDP